MKPYQLNIGFIMRKNQDVQMKVEGKKLRKK